jgi:hypothetical protein
MSHRERYRIAPQLAAYGQISTVLAPYLTLIQEPNYRSEIINTDSGGFRFSYRDDVRIDVQSWWSAEKRGIVLGGSFVFGIGATDDRKTLVSTLNSKTGFSFMNLGIRAGNSTQELIAAIPFIAESEYILVCSGINNLVVSIQSAGENDVYGPLFSEGLLKKLSSYPDAELMKRLSLDDVGTTDLFKLLIARIKKVVFGKMPEQKAGRKSTAVLQEYSRSFLEDVSKKAIKRTGRDLGILVKAFSDTSNIVFAVQPFASAISKMLTPEEEQLFAITDNMQLKHWQMLKTELIQLWPAYVHALENICAELDIRFVDLNRIKYNGWVFVDRVHMNDAGYMQSAHYLAQEFI